MTGKTGQLAFNGSDESKTIVVRRSKPSTVITRAIKANAFDINDFYALKIVIKF